MKRLLSIVFAFISLSAIAQYQVNQPGNKKLYANPIFAGDFPDPSILRDGDDYYMVHSSFEYYPGLLIWHSKDLINWAPVANALHRYVGSVWAPDLVKYQNRYYIYFPANNNNYVVYADCISGPWSDPINLSVGNIDPGHVVDENGKRYLYFSSGGYVPLSEDGLSVTGTIQHSFNGWPIPRGWSIECFCMEGPKIVKRGEYYFLTTAEGGTAGPATSHMIISARSKSPLGPWENSPYNPIIRTQSNQEKWCSKGHGTLFEDGKGKWWLLYHAYEKDFYNKGRQTMLEPVEWTEDGWFKVPKGVKADGLIRKPDLDASPTDFSLNDKFASGPLQPHWKFFGAYDSGRYSFEKSGLVLQGKGDGVGNCGPLLCVPMHHSYTTDVELEIEGEATAGLVLFYNSSYFSGILADKENILSNLRGWQFTTEKKVINRRVFLRLKNHSNTVDMYYSKDGVRWIKTENSADVSGLHHNVLSGFLGLRIGLCAIGKGKVHFKNFRYLADR